MGAWIEIVNPSRLILFFISRTPRWVRGLKLCCAYIIRTIIDRRTPRWVRGLKYSTSKHLVTTA